MLVQHLKVIIGVLSIYICLVPTVNALGVGPLSLDVSVEKGKETVFTQNIQVLNSETRPIHVTVSVSGPISEFVTIEPKEFDMPAGPGPMSLEPRPYKNVKVIFRIPREISASNYKGQILFTEQPTKGGTLATSVQLGVSVNLNVGKMAEARFPSYINAMTGLLIVLMSLAIVLPYEMRREV